MCSDISVSFFFFVCPTVILSIYENLRRRSFWLEVMLYRGGFRILLE